MVWSSGMIGDQQIGDGRIQNIKLKIKTEKYTNIIKNRQELGFSRFYYRIAGEDISRV
jgi:hypothetical protein